jgi:hypothetical protein
MEIIKEDVATIITVDANVITVDANVIIIDAKVKVVDTTKKYSRNLYRSGHFF